MNEKSDLLEALLKLADPEDSSEKDIEEAFKVVANKLSTRIAQHAAKYLDTKESVQDITQDVLLRIYTHAKNLYRLKEFKNRPKTNDKKGNKKAIERTLGAFFVWVLKATQREAMRHQNKEKKMSPLDEHMKPLLISGRESFNFDAKDLLAIIQPNIIKAMDSMKKKEEGKKSKGYCKIVKMRLRHKTNEEIARSLDLNLTSNALKQKIHRAITVFRKELQKQFKIALDQPGDEHEKKILRRFLDKLDKLFNPPSTKKTHPIPKTTDNS